MRLTVSVNTGMELVLHPQHPLYVPAKRKEVCSFSVENEPGMKQSPYKIFFSIQQLMITIATVEPLVTRAYKEWCTTLFEGVPYDGASSRVLLGLILNRNCLRFEMDDFVVELQLEYDPSELALFVDGVDGSGKSFLVNQFTGRDDVCVTYELGSIHKPHLPHYNTKQLILAGRSQSACPARDSHYAFAERWHAWSLLVKEPRLVLSDRSWISTLFYQGIEDTSLITDIVNEGHRFTNHLYRNGKFPLYLLLTNDPYTTPSTDSLECMLAEKHILYRMAAGMPVDETTLAQYDVLSTYTWIDYAKLPIHGMPNTEIKKLIDMIVG